MPKSSINLEHSEQSAPVTLTAEQVNAVINHIDVAGELKAMFAALGRGEAVQPPQTITEFPNGVGDFITYTGYIKASNVFGAKLSPYIVTPDKPVITAWTYLMSAQTGQPLLCADSGELTTQRTAGTTALAVDYLAKLDSKVLAVVGSGAIAQAHIRHTLRLRSWQSIRVYSPSLASDSVRQQQLKSIDERVEIVTDKALLIADADVIMLCTSSGTPVIEASDIPKGALVTSISTNVANAHEVCPLWLNQADVYCDYKATTPGSAGEMKLAQASGSWSAEDICGDLADLAVGQCQLPEYERPVFFRSVGLGLEDLAIAHGLWLLVQSIAAQQSDS